LRNSRRFMGGSCGSCVAVFTPHPQAACHPQGRAVAG
jgi:hypothetical protein